MTFMKQNSILLWEFKLKKKTYFRTEFSKMYLKITIDIKVKIEKQSGILKQKKKRVHR